MDRSLMVGLCCQNSDLAYTPEKRFRRQKLKDRSVSTSFVNCTSYIN